MGPARRPELLEFSAELLACACPVCNDVVAKILDVTLDIQLILLEPADVELLS